MGARSMIHVQQQALCPTPHNEAMLFLLLLLLLLLLLPSTCTPCSFFLSAVKQKQRQRSATHTADTMHSRAVAARSI